jgi:quinol monooxygenase YgiN
MTEATLIVRHGVEDYAAWRTVYDSLDGLRAEHGCFGAEVLTDPADQKDLIILHRFPSVEQAQAFAGSDGLKAGMADAGVTGPPRIEIAVKA